MAAEQLAFCIIGESPSAVYHTMYGKLLEETEGEYRSTHIQYHGLSSREG